MKRCTTKTPTTGATTSSTNRDSAGAGRDRVFGEDGNDFIAAGVHNDRVDGGAGDDEIDSGKDLDHLTGGAGRDLFFSADSSIDQLFGGDDADRARIDRRLDVQSNRSSRELFMNSPIEWLEDRAL